MEVKAHVEAAARELSLERFAKFENDLYQVLHNDCNAVQLSACSIVTHSSFYADICRKYFHSSMETPSEKRLAAFW